MDRGSRWAEVAEETPSVVAEETPSVVAEETPSVVVAVAVAAVRCVMGCPKPPLE